MNDYDGFQFTQTSTDEYTDLLTELHTLYSQDQPEDVLQYCFNFFNTKLQEQRADFLNEQRPGSGKFCLVLK